MTRRLDQLKQMRNQTAMAGIVACVAKTGAFDGGMKIGVADRNCCLPSVQADHFAENNG